MDVLIFIQNPNNSNKSKFNFLILVGSVRRLTNVVGKKAFLTSIIKL